MNVANGSEASGERTGVQCKRWSGGAWCTSIVDSSDKVPDNKRSRRIDESIRLGLCQIDHRSLCDEACGWQCMDAVGVGGSA